MMMNTIHKTRQFNEWLSNLRDGEARRRIYNRIYRAEKGNFGDHRAIGDGVSEMRVHYGPGYRIYYAQAGDVIYLLLLGGDKQTQHDDIERATAIWKARLK